jgi:hypothetical protein
VRTGTKLGALVVLGFVSVSVVTGGAFLATSGRGDGTEKLLVREERAPLERRVILPTGVRRVRWVAVAAFSDSGWLEAPEKPYDLYALLEIDPTSPRSSKAQTVVLPVGVARALLPASVTASAPDKDGNVAVSGTALLAPIPSRKAGAGVRAAVRVDAGLLLHIFQGGGS